MKITRSQVKAISEALDSLFFGIKAKVLGKYYRGPKIYFTVEDVNPLESLDGLFHWVLSLGHPEAKIDEQQVKQLSAICSNYITAEHLKIKNKVFADIRQAKSPTEIGPLINASLEQATQYMDTLVNNEIRTTQAFAEKEGITQVAASLGDEDPTVVFLGVCDDKRCKYCRKMYSDPRHERKPIPYKLSQLQEGYFKAKDWDGITPHTAPLHPHCRDVMSYVPMTYGMDDNGVIVYRGIGYDYYKDYHGLKKSESLPPEADFSGFDEYLREQT